MSKRITTITLAALFLFSSCSQISANVQVPIEKTHQEQIDPSLIISTNTAEEEDTTVLPSYTPTKEVEATPTLTNTATLERPTKALPPIETPTPKPPVEFHIPPGELGYNYFYFPYTSFEEDGMQMISFVSGELLDVEVEGEYIVVTIRTRVRDNEVILKSKTKGFNLFNENIDTVFGGTEEGYYTYITPENIDEVPVGIEIHPDFLYTMFKMSEENKSRAFLTCRNQGMEPGRVSARRRYTPVCDNMDALYVDGVGKLSADTVAEEFAGGNLSIHFVLTNISYGRPEN